MKDIHLDEAVAADYDTANPISDAELEPVLATLSSLADGGNVLEFAIGTGRIGLPLSQQGVRLQGVEFSAPMLEQLRAKSGGDQIPVTLGDMSSTRVDGEFSLVYLVYNTIMNLTTQAGQVACFRNAANHLVDGGYFLIEVMVPRLRSLPPGERFQPFAVSKDHVGMDEFVSFQDQILRSHHYSSDNHSEESDRFIHRVGEFRWVWPSELDLMAEMAGLKLVHRWADWDQSAFSDDSDSHISVWQKG